MLPISHLRSGEIADVAQIVGTPEQVRRLEELGIRNGERLEMVQPGSPCIVRVGGAKLCFREDDLLRVIVTPRKIA